MITDAGAKCWNSDCCVFILASSTLVFVGAVWFSVRADTSSLASASPSTATPHFIASFARPTCYSYLAVSTHSHPATCTHACVCLCVFLVDADETVIYGSLQEDIRSSTTHPHRRCCQMPTCGQTHPRAHTHTHTEHTAIYTQQQLR